VGSVGDHAQPRQRPITIGEFLLGKMYILDFCGNFSEKKSVF
jgi:hypothetical protein